MEVSEVNGEFATSSEFALADSVAQLPPVAPAAPAPAIVKTADAPLVTELAESVGGALETVTVLVLSAEVLALVETPK